MGMVGHDEHLMTIGVYTGSRYLLALFCLR